MAINFIKKSRRLFGWLTLILFGLFFGNIVLAKAGMLLGSSFLLLPNFSEFIIFLAATFFLTGFLLFNETEN